jgi:hypothetical protein
MTRKIRTTMRPDQEIEVGDAEYLDLQRQGLVLDPEAPAPDPGPAVTKKAAPPAATKEG